MHRVDASGVIFKIAPFNSPLWVGLKLAVPAMALGNSVLLRASETCGGLAEFFDLKLKESDVLGLEMAFSHVEDTENIIKNPYIKGE
jgi:acyl-CoA reductase-like NAD-dependent aldehyde dehydrogenase